MSDDQLLKILSDAVVLDTGIYIEYLGNTTLGKKIDNLVISNPDIQTIVITDLVISELYYVYCRLHNEKMATQMITELLNTVTICPSSQIRIIAGQLKCKRAISITDCYSIAAGEYHDIPILFKAEDEIIIEINKAPFKANIIMLGQQ